MSIACVCISIGSECACVGLLASVLMLFISRKATLLTSRPYKDIENLIWSWLQAKELVVLERKFITGMTCWFLRQVWILI